MSAERKIKTFEDLQEKYGVIEIAGNNLRITQVMDGFVGSVVNARDVADKIEEMIGEGEYLTLALDVLFKTHFLYEMKWAIGGGGYEIGQPFREVPVVFRGNNLAVAIVPADKAKEFAELNPDWSKSDFDD